MLFIVEDCPVGIRELDEALGAREKSISTSATEARSRLASPAEWAGMIIDIGLPEGLYAGLDLLREMRELPALAKAPCIVLTGQFDERIAGVSTELGARFIPKPATFAKLEPFLEETARRWTRTRRAIAERARARYGLSKMQTEVLGWLLAGRRRRAFCHHFEVSYDTFRDHQRLVLAKTGDEDAASLVARLFAEALDLEDA